MTEILSEQYTQTVLKSRDNPLKKEKTWMIKTKKVIVILMITEIIS